MNRKPDHRYSKLTGGAREPSHTKFLEDLDTVA